MAVERFQEYLRIVTVQPNPDYEGAVKFLKNQCEEIGLEWQLHELHKGKPIAIMSWPGKNSKLPSILLNSHMDVVPVFPEHWTHDPFAATKTEDGKIYGRGTQDMKCVGMQYLEAIRKLKDEGVTCLRTIHVSFVPDEEIGSKLGMEVFCKSEAFKRLNVGFGLDEGIASANDKFKVFYGERIITWIRVVCCGNPGHGSLFIKDTAAEKMRQVINRFLDFRAKEEERLEKNKQLTLGDVTTVNLNILEGGVQPNVIPAEMAAVFDVRLTPNQTPKQFFAMVDDWIREIGDGITYTLLQLSGTERITQIEKTNKWWQAFNDACQEMKLELQCEIFPAATDGRFLRELDLPVLGFSPMNHTPVLLHDHDEFLHEDIFLKGIDIYRNLLPSLANAIK